MTENVDDDDGEASCFGCLLFGGLGFLIIGCIWIFGAYGMLFIGALMILLAFAFVYIAVTRRPKGERDEP